MPQWQYKFVNSELRNEQWCATSASENETGEPESLQSHFEQLGQYGWELVQVLTPQAVDGQPQKCQFIFKREAIRLPTWLAQDEQTVRLMLEAPPSAADAARALDAIYQSSQRLNKSDVEEASAIAVAALLANPCPGSLMVLRAVLNLHPVMKKHAALALAELGDERAIPELLEVVHSSEDSAELRRTVIGIAKLGDDFALDQVCNSILSGKHDDSGRDAMISGLFIGGREQAEEYLIRILQEGDEDLQQEVRGWLREISTPRADAALQEWYAEREQRWPHKKQA